MARITEARITEVMEAYRESQNIIFCSLPFFHLFKIMNNLP